MTRDPGDPEVDERDLEILERLEEDSRIPWRRLAKELGVSEATIYIRVRKLTEKGILRGYTIRVDPARLGLSVEMFALVRAEASSIPEIRRLLPRLKYVSEVYEVSGQYHFLVRIQAPSLDEASEAVDEIMGLPGVVEVSRFTVLRRVKSNTRIVREYREWVAPGGGGRARASGHRPG